MRASDVANGATFTRPYSAGRREEPAFSVTLNHDSCLIGVWSCGTAMRRQPRLGECPVSIDPSHDQVADLRWLDGRQT